MKTRMSGLLVPTLLAATISAAAALAQAPQPPEAQQRRERPDRPRLSPDTLNRLQDGRLAMMRESLEAR